VPAAEELALARRQLRKTKEELRDANIRLRKVQAQQGGDMKLVGGAAGVAFLLGRLLYKDKKQPATAPAPAARAAAPEQEPEAEVGRATKKANAKNARSKL
jgi:hypothetical protein